MKRIWLTLSPLLLCGCSLGATKVVVVTATPTRPHPTANAATVTNSLPPAAFALTEANVPTDMKQQTARFHSNAEVAGAYGIGLSELQRRGRITSFETEFRANAVSGMLDVDDIVAEWKTPAGARWDYSRVVAGVQHPGVREIAPHTISARDLGDRRTALSFRSKGQANNLRDYAVVFTRGRYRAYLQIVAVYGTVSDADVLRLAKLIDQRIQNAP